MSSGGAALQPTFQGHVSTTQDALVLFEACLQGHLSHVPRRPHDRERSSLIRSGSVFIYEENASGIKRWTDGVTWSPSRILGNFLVYRELDKPFPPGEKKRAMKKQNRRPSRPGEPYPTSLGGGSENGSFGSPNGERAPTEVERQLIGSLIDSYGFKPDGLVKKTMSVTVQGVTHHLVSYYNVNDVMNSQLRTPGQTDNLQYIRPRPELTSKQSFRSPLEEGDDVEGMRDGQQAYRYGMGHQPYVQDYRQPYAVPQYYPPMSQAPPSGYSSGVPPMQQSQYMQTAVAPPQMPGPPRAEYASYDQNSYGRAYESKAPPSTMPPMMGDRNQSIMYPPTSSMQRPVSNMSPAGMDQSRNMSYRPGYTASPIDGHRPTEERRESGPPPSQMYSSRAPYYGEGSQSQMHQHQPPYSQNPTNLSGWSTSNHAGQQS